MQYIIALDQSTSATKAILYDLAGNLIDKASVEHRQIYPQPGHVEHDASEIWANTLTAIKTLASKIADKLSSVKFVSITNQRETFVVFDRKTGEPIHHAIVWQCRRGLDVCAQLRNAGKEKLVNAKTGLKIDTYFSAPKLAWLIRNKPEIAAKLKTGEAAFGTIDAYLIHRLTNGKTFATDHTNASRTLLLDIHTMKWDDELCALFGVPKDCLPEVRDSTANFGSTDLGGVLKGAVPLIGVMGDSQASLFAHRCFSPGSAKVTLGTGSSVLLNIGASAKDAGEGAVTTIAWTHAGKATYSFEGIINYSAATVAWLKDGLKLINSAAETEAAALEVKDNGGVYLVPAFAGLSAPYWSPDAKAAIVGMTSGSNRNHIIRAALESIAYQLRDVLDMMRQRAGVDLKRINADGGAIRNAFLMQFIADMTGLEIVAAPIAECSPLGAALAGALGAGVYKSLDEIAKLPNEGIAYKPKMSVEESTRLHAGWQRAVKQVLAGV